MFNEYNKITVNRVLNAVLLVKKNALLFNSIFGQETFLSIFSNT